MIRVIVHIAKAAIAALIALLFVSCGMNFKTVEGNGNIISQNRPLSNDFTTIDGGGSFEIIVEQGSPQTVTVQADDNLQPHILTKVNNGTLEIDSDVNINGGTTRIIIKMPVLKEISLSGSATLKGKNNFKAEDIALSASGSSVIDIYVEADGAAIETSGAAKINISGKSEKLNCDSSGSSVINARDLPSKKVSADASGSSMIQVNPIESLSADGSGSSSITYKNTPDDLSKDTSGSANVSQQK